MNSCSESTADLKMVKVRKSRKGNRKSGSLVFRISRVSAKSLDDSRETLLNSVEQQTLNPEESVNVRPCTLKIKIPQLTLQNSLADNKTDSIVAAKTLEPGNENNQTAGSFNINSTVPDIEGNVCLERRRSSRRILLRLQNSALDVPANEDNKNKEDQQHSENNDEQHSDSLSDNKVKVSNGEKKKRKKTASKAESSESVTKKRRGRPPKFHSDTVKDYTIMQPVMPGSLQIDTEKKLLQPSNNSVWTLVPKELLESEFFKSQILKVRFAIPKDNSQNKFVASSSSCSLPVSSLFQFSNNEMIQFKIPRTIQPSLPFLQPKPVDQKDYKRPTVIYFKNEKKDFNNTDNQLQHFENPGLQLENHQCKRQNDLAYLFNKYHMLEDETLTSYYDLAGGNLNEAENMLADLFSNQRIVAPEMRVLRNCVSASTSPERSIVDFTSGIPVSSENDSSHSLDSSSMLEDNDDLSRKLIVESLHVLFNEEAVLS